MAAIQEDRDFGGEDAVEEWELEAGE